MTVKPYPKTCQPGTPRISQPLTAALTDRIGDLELGPDDPLFKSTGHGRVAETVDHLVSFIARG